MISSVKQFCWKSPVRAQMPGTPGSGHAGAGTLRGLAGREPGQTGWEWAGVRMRRTLGAPGPGHSRQERRDTRTLPLPGNRLAPGRARPTLTRGRPRTPIGCLRTAHGSHWASAASAASPLVHHPLPTPRHFLTPFPPPAPPAARRVGGGIWGARDCDWRTALPLRSRAGRRAVQLLKGAARPPEAGAVLSA